MTIYTIRESSGVEVLTIEAGSVLEARRLAHEWIQQGPYNEVEKTFWVRAYMYWEEYDGEYQEILTVRIDPEEPECIEDNHDWQSPYDLLGGVKENPGVWGHGGGVIIKEVCMNCGCQRTTDTWAQNTETGEQGLESVSYQSAAFEVNT